MLLNTTIFLEMCYYFDITQILNRFINKQNYTYKLILYYRGEIKCMNYQWLKVLLMQL